MTTEMMNLRSLVEKTPVPAQKSETLSKCSVSYAVPIPSWA
jgi:hypothetical protein